MLFIWNINYFFLKLENQNIIIITDSMTTINNIKFWNKRSYKEQIKCNSADIIYRIHKISKEKNISVEYHHIYSHLLDSRFPIPPDVYKERMNKVNQRFQILKIMSDVKMK